MKKIRLGEGRWTEITNSGCEKLLGVTIDNRLNFNDHLDCIIKKTGRAANTLSRVTPYMNNKQKNQSGFKPGDSWINQLLSVTHDINLLTMGYRLGLFS